MISLTIFNYLHVVDDCCGMCKPRVSHHWAVCSGEVVLSPTLESPMCCHGTVGSSRHNHELHEDVDKGCSSIDEWFGSKNNLDSYKKNKVLAKTNDLYC